MSPAWAIDSATIPAITREARITASRSRSSSCDSPDPATRQLYTRIHCIDALVVQLQRLCELEFTREERRCSESWQQAIHPRPPVRTAWPREGAALCQGAGDECRAR